MNPTLPIPPSPKSGPTAIQLVNYVCNGCQYHSIIDRQPPQSKEHYCEHPKIVAEDDLEIAPMRVNYEVDGRFIKTGKDSTPSWCPFLTPK